jgi:hypothetical protein
LSAADTPPLEPLTGAAASLALNPRILSGTCVS